MPVPIRPLFLYTALIAASLAAPAARAQDPDAYALDPVHTRVLVAVEHAGFSQALGTVSGSTGALVFDPEDWSSARLDVRVPLAKLDFGDADWNRAVQAASLLDVRRHPEARFTSDTVAPTGERRARACGTLELRGIVRPLCLDVTLNAIERYPMPPFRRTAGFSATATLSRADFGITAWKSVIGDTVTLRIEAEAVRDRDAAARLDTPPGDVTAPPAGANPSQEGGSDALEAAAAAAAEAAAIDDDTPVTDQDPPPEPTP